MPVTGNDILEATGGLLVQGDPGISVAGFAIDTRRIAPGDFFVPLAGDKEDGHCYVTEAFEKGAAGTFYALSPLPEFPAGALVIRVKDPLAALQMLASAHRRRFDLPVVAVTGSSGKTSTKDLVAGVLGVSGPVLMTPGNLNNEIGLPLTLLALNRRHRAAVVEMGMSAPGEIAALTRIARPKIAVITNVGPAHLEQLGSLEGVAAAKRELLEHMDQRGVAVLNSDDPLVRKMGEDFPGQVCYYGFSGGDYRAGRWSYSNGTGRFKVCFPDGQEHPFELPVPGKRMVENALAAIAVGGLFGLTPAEMVRGIASCRLTAGRLQIRPAGKITIVDDTYNANPDSVKASLQALKELGGNKTVAVLGDMLELGAAAARLHREVGRFAARLKVGYVVTVGGLAEQIAAGAKAGGTGTFACQDHEQALQALSSLPLGEGWFVLVKGSRGMKMERLVSSLLKLWDQGG